MNSSSDTTKVPRLKRRPRSFCECGEEKDPRAVHCWTHMARPNKGHWMARANNLLNRWLAGELMKDLALAEGVSISRISRLIVQARKQRGE